MDKYIYLVEGDTEEHLVKQLKSSGEILAGKIEVWNICQHKVKNIIRNLSINSIVIVITDLDIHRNNSYNNYLLLSENLKNLVENSKRVYLISQKDNLEDELMIACNCTKGNLFSKLKVTTASDFKREFLKCKNFIEVFDTFNKESLWKNEDDLLLKKLSAYMKRSKIETNTKIIKKLH